MRLVCENPFVLAGVELRGIRSPYRSMHGGKGKVIGTSCVHLIIIRAANDSYYEFAFFHLQCMRGVDLAYGISNSLRREK